MLGNICDPGGSQPYQRVNSLCDHNVGLHVLYNLSHLHIFEDKSIAAIYEAPEATFAYLLFF